MSLATRCTACGTVFRVVQDQLKASEGWVRCGRCGDVFNALEGLFDLERESAPAWTPSQRGPLDLLPASADEHAAQAAARDEPIAEPESGAAEDTLIDTRADSQIETRQPEPDDLDQYAVGRGEDSGFDDEAALNLPAGAASPEPTPEFLRHAENAARWQRPGVRLTLSAAATLLGLLLAGQWILWQRDAIAARWPAAAPLLAHACEPLACRIEPLRRLDGLAVESSGLTQLDSPSHYRLQVALRNRDAQALMTPSLDITLTDNRGEIVARKVLGPREFGAAATATMDAGTELALQAVLDSGERRISGYSIEIFYP
ncbi:MAG: zinc-ribbon and DUF3426 domain-containing protein [Burkholderiaceae bacterium]|nr:zinc-ribbon and DUF3426 domain-containing protein [Burkholderiaceae bacterium]